MEKLVQMALDSVDIKKQRIPDEITGSDIFTYRELAPYAPPELWVADPQKATILALKESGLADGNDYLERYPDVKSAKMDPYEHYVIHGINEGRELKSTLNRSCNKIYRHGTLQTLYGDALTLQWIITSMCNYN